ncbi:MAG TPA: YqcC family protein [Cyclobacteriaceae bacterium]|nr:YqcC family protein [Cyclobacteriaceae bacterium]
MPAPELYKQVSAKAGEIEAELKRLGRWDSQPLPDDRFEDMGAFGSHTMTFEQWIQFVLIPRINGIIANHDEFPSESNLAPYAIRYFDGDPDAENIHQLLYDLDALINGKTGEESLKEFTASSNEKSPPLVTMGDTVIPQVVYSLIEVLHQFEGDPLESQLQTYDTFLAVLSPSIRPEISRLLRTAAARATNPESKQRIEKAADSVASGGRAAEPYDHDAAMKKYQEEFRKGYPGS